ncbi:substrate-binding domain-containing protein [Tichowtungia aerotolerans]|uniref:Substrate-binding domain-containing protein n=1 Tax=Tichowtungia aerotolerans TaxID=2697043 RepID=A0A6P1M5K4_9BACT|nr:substrate-binding domain-containing protein [Tichowtungia aerotolerans]QHI70069.1 substrate-binding domain-containing protein [Tichowtungia aerotolerans]
MDEAGFTAAPDLTRIIRPEDIALMGFNGIDLFSEKAARLSTVKIPFYQMAYKATEKLLEVLEGQKPYTPGFYEVPAELVIRESTFRTNETRMPFR